MAINDAPTPLLEITNIIDNWALRESPQSAFAEY